MSKHKDKYIICWKSKNTGYTDKTKPVDKEFAEAAMSLKIHFPEIKYWIEKYEEKRSKQDDTQNHSSESD